ncbi:unnamed protein product (mitochondrion) [Plasmodiophora brassicae]|uniref:Ketoreductase domain-containing protein n=1 Tax=Plasmodiophora brassicae TaxID=37360 RepID=A0A3P3Y5E1_PLABS|nr:unnamed protein product [Plasmodiophora brassicae]
MLRFDGRTAIVTGGGGALGRSYARMLARRGANVVVNDINAALADETVALIKQEGAGNAVANYDPVGSDGARVVRMAVEKFGRIDIVICNAGSLKDSTFHKMSTEDWEVMNDVHVRGAFHVVRAAWPLMREQRYGRVILTSSSVGLFGNFGAANYGAAKMALLGLANTLSIEGAKHGVHVNTITPLAHSPLSQGVIPATLLNILNCEYVAPVVAYLCHESCTETGGLFEIGAGCTSRLRWQRSRGMQLAMPHEASSVEHVAQHWAGVNDFSSGTTFPTSAAEVVEHISARAVLLTDQVSPASTSFDGFKSREVVERLQTAIETQGQGAGTGSRSTDKYVLVDGPDGRSASFVIDSKGPTPKLHTDPAIVSGIRPDREYELADTDFQTLMTKMDGGVLRDSMSTTVTTALTLGSAVCGMAML